MIIAVIVSILVISVASLVGYRWYLTSESLSLEENYSNKPMEFLSEGLVEKLLANQEEMMLRVGEVMGKVVEETSKGISESIIAALTPVVGPSTPSVPFSYEDMEKAFQTIQESASEEIILDHEQDPWLDVDLEDTANMGGDSGQAPTH